MSVWGRSVPPLVRMVFRCTPHLGRTFQPLRFMVLSLWGHAVPYTPFLPPHAISKKHGYPFGGLGFSMYICTKQIFREKHT